MNDITIVGGGFTGIATALNINNKRIKLYEASNQLGGILRDHTNLNDIFFSSCQYLDANSLLLNKLQLTEDFYKFEHRYGSYTDIFGKITISKNFAGPVYTGFLDSNLIKNTKFTNLKERLMSYPTQISNPLLNWFKSIGVDSIKTHHSAISGFQADRIYCAGIHEKIFNLKSSSIIADQLYGLPREYINKKKIYSLLPLNGFNKYFDYLEKNLSITLNMKKIAKPFRVGNKVHIGNKDYKECPNLLVWTANPSPLFKELFNVKLDSMRHYAETLTGYIDRKVEIPFYIQVFSSQTSILRIYVYNINGKGCFSIEKAFDKISDNLVMENAQSIINNFFSYNFSNIISRVRSTRYFVYSVNDFKLLKYYQDNSDIDNLIFANFLEYGRNEKVKSILDQMND